jgi:hypothetical protein
LLTLLDRAGYVELDVDDWRGLLPIGGGLPAAEAANFALASFSSFGELLAEAGNGAPFPASARRCCLDERERSHLHRRAP